MPMTWKRFFASLMIICLCGASAMAADTVNRVVAEVGDDIITSMDVEKVVRTMLAQSMNPGSPPPDSERMKQLEVVALDRLIEAKIFEQEVKRLGVRVSKAEIDSYINRVKKVNRIDDKGFAAQLSRRGITPEEYRDELRKDILKHKLITRQVKGSIVISDDQVEQYYKKNLDQYRNMDQVRLKAIFINIPRDAPPAARASVKKQVEAVRKMAEEGKDFAGLAKQYSQGPGADKGGDLGLVASKDLIPEMRQALSGLSPGQISPVLDIPSGYAILQMVSRTGESTVPLKDVKDQIRAKLEDEAMEKKFGTWMKELKGKTYVRKIN